MAGRASGSSPSRTSGNSSSRWNRTSGSSNRRRSGRGYQPAPPTPGNAIASLILGIIGIVLCPIVTSVVGLILGYSAKKEIDNSGGRLGGRGVAMGGIITSWIGLAIYIPIVALIVIGVAVGS